MLVKTIAILFFLAISTICLSQEKLTKDIVDITRVSFLNPGFSYEKRIGKYQSILGQALLSTKLSFGFSSSLKFFAGISFDPALSFQYRYYYNYERRQNKGKNTKMNSANYLSPTFKTFFSKDRVTKYYYAEEPRRPINTVGLVWGMQRNFKDRLSLNFNIGLGYLFTSATTANENFVLIQENIGKLSPLGQLNFGFWLNKKK